MYVLLKQRSVSIRLLDYFKLLKLFGFQTCRFWAYLMKVIPETRCAHQVWCQRFISIPIICLWSYHYEGCSRNEAVNYISTFLFPTTILLSGPPLSWSYGSWIYNYLCNQCLQPLKLWVSMLFMAVRWFSSDIPISSTNETESMSHKIPVGDSNTYSTRR
jgi:hypothetical protein